MPESAPGTVVAREHAAPVERSSTLVPEIVVYTTDWCGFCARATALLEAEGVPFREIEVGDDPTFRQRVFDLGGRWTVPLVVVDGRPIGGYQELAAAVRSGRLAELLAAA